jgi:hypothetical protein
MLRTKILFIFNLPIDKLFCLLTLLFINTVPAYSQGWEKKYGKGEYYGGYAGAAAVYDNGFAICETNSRGKNDRVVKTDINGNILWTKYLADSISLSAIKTTREGGFILGGQTGKYPFLKGTSILIKLDACGNMAWGTDFYYRDYNFIDKVNEMPNGDIIAEGLNYGHHTAAKIFCVDKNGSLKWQFSDGQFQGGDVLSCPDGNILLSGENYTVDNGDSAILILHAEAVMLNPAGKPVWRDIYGRNKTIYTQFHTPFLINKNEYLIVGNNRNDSNLRQGSIILMKYDNQGNRQVVNYLGDSTLLGGVTMPPG